MPQGVGVQVPPRALFLPGTYECLIDLPSRFPASSHAEWRRFKSYPRNLPTYVESSKSQRIPNKQASPPQATLRNTMEASGDTQELLLEALYSLPLPNDQKDIDELLPLSSWLYDPLFLEVMGAGPYQLTHCPRGRSLPPDWGLFTPNKRVSIEVTKLTTPRTEYAQKYGRSTFDTPGVGVSLKIDKQFCDLVAEHPSEISADVQWELFRPNQATFLRRARTLLKTKHSDLQQYREFYDFRVLLIYEKLWSSRSMFEQRVERIARWLSRVLVGGFDAVVITDGFIRTESIARLL